MCNEKLHVATRFSIYLPSGSHICLAHDSMLLKAVSFCALMPRRLMCISVQCCSRRIAGVWMLFGIARVSFVTVSDFRRYLMMFDFGHHRSTMFFHFDRGSLMLLSATIVWTVLLRTAQYGSPAFGGQFCWFSLPFGHMFGSNFASSL